MRCPVCRAENTEGEACRRCKADLSLLYKIEAQREHAAATARRHLVAGSVDEALEAAAHSHRCRPDAESFRLLALANLYKRNFTAAWRSYLAAQNQHFRS